MLSNIENLLFPKFCLNCKYKGNFICFACRNLLQPQLPECYICRRISRDFITHSNCFKKQSLTRVAVCWKYENTAKKILSTFKYKCSYKIAQEIAELITIRSFSQSKDLQKKTLILPVPIHKSRLNQRGFNQTELLAEVLSNTLKVDYSNSLLERSRHTSKQHSLSREQRSKNLEGAFKIRDPTGSFISKYQKVIIVDDVITTGSTLNEISKLLCERQNSIKVEGLCLFRGRPRYSLIAPH